MDKLTLKEITCDDASCHIDPCEIYELAEFTQARFYGRWQENVGKKVRRFIVFLNREPILYMQLISCPLISDKIYYTIPYGPVIRRGFFNKEVAKFLKKELKKIMLEDNAIFTRLDFTPFEFVKESKDNFLNSVFTRSPWWSVHGACFQPRVEWWLPINPNEEEILTNMHQKTRYNIRLAKRKGVNVKIIDKDILKYLDKFYELQKETAKRAGFSLHSREYYESVFKSVEKNRNGFLAVAYYNDEILTINFVINYGKISMFLFGGSSRNHRNLMSNYLAHWESILYTKSIGMKYYNFGGYFDKDGPRIKKKNLGKRLKFSIFKKKFGGQKKVHGDFYDCVNNSLWYALYIVRKYIYRA